MKPSRIAVAAAGLMLAFATAAEASYSPIKYFRSRAELATACEKLGARGEGYGLDRRSGPYGCRDMESGNVVACTADGACADYSGDPRWRKIHDWLEGGAARAPAIPR